MKGSVPCHRGELTPREKFYLMQCVENEVKSLAEAISKETGSSARGFLQADLNAKQQLLSKIGGW